MTVLRSSDYRGLAGERLFAFEGVRRAGQPRTAMAIFSFIHLFKKIFLAELAFAVSWGYSVVVMGRLLIVVASLVVEHRL